MGCCVSKQEQQVRRRDRSGSSLDKSDENTTTIQSRQPPDLAQFELRRVIGRGTFGKVKVVVHKASGRTYALKYISKVVCVARQAAVNVIRERKIMEVLHHPLVCNLRYAFQDVEYLYIVSDLMLGGDLRFHLLRKTFTESAIRMWIAETVSALSYCHSRGIVHRDVKPDNILLTAEGHCKLADFNISTQIRGGNLARTRSGSLFYMAPEIHDGLPYDFAIDYWSLGVVFFEAIYGHRPFCGKTSQEVVSSIRQCECPLAAYTPPVSPECEDAMRALLKCDPQARLHAQADVAALPFFSSLDWHSIGLGHAMPVFVPGSDKNFDAAWELEEILLHDSPLEPRRLANKKKVVPENQAAADMYKLMEVHFKDFDFATAPDLNNQKFSILQQPGSLISDAALTSGIIASPNMDFVDVDERRIAAATSNLQTATLTTQDDQQAVTKGGGGGGGGGIFKSKSKKPVIVPPGVLALKAGGRAKVVSTTN